MLIGVSRYAHPDIFDIPAAATNIADLEQLLTDPNGGGFAVENCIVVREPSNASQVGNALMQATHQATDVLLVYYTGHGLLDRRGRLHLALRHSDPDQVGWTTLPFTTLREEILGSVAANRILILDCCFSGRAFEAMSDDPAVGQVEINGTYVVVSSAENETSIAPTGHRNTAFTAALLTVARKALGATLDELYRSVDRHLQMNGHPRPHRRGKDTTGDLVLFSRPNIESQYRRADADDPDATYDPGVLFEDGDDGGQAEAMTWFHQAAAGDPDAMYNLGVLFENRGGLIEAEAWYRRAAAAGHTDVKYKLGYLLMIGGDLIEAETWFRRAADAGCPGALYDLGRLYRMRGGLIEAETWFRQAADAGDADAMFALGRIHWKHGDVSEAEVWFRRAADVGHPHAMTNLELVRRPR
ncbi:caspase, EACC1-associated type [Nocardia colli]|uniref:caspase, EACC1-associated type n=1 Tax=Nocardia colli TaxID=2545717 RepID=UPI0035DB819F